MDHGRVSARRAIERWAATHHEEPDAYDYDLERWALRRATAYEPKTTTKPGRLPRKENYHLRELPSSPYKERELPPRFAAFVAEALLPRLALRGYKLDRKERVATQAIHNLYLAGASGAVADGRGTQRAEVRERAKIWEAIVAAGLARACVGSEETRRVTRYRATPELLELFEGWELCDLLDLDLKRNTTLNTPTRHALVYLHTGTKDLATGKPLPKDQQRQPLPLPDDPDLRRYYAEMEDRIEQINRGNLGHTWQAFATDPETGRRYVYQPNVCLRRIHVGALGRAARLYTWGGCLSGQNMPKAERRAMLIDGQPAAELDFGGLHTRMLYHFAGLDPAGDVYRPEHVLPRYYPTAPAEERAVLRGFVKEATNTLWNVASRAAANSSVGKALAEHEQSELLHRVLYDVEGTNPVDLVARIMAAHPNLAHRFFKEIGTDLMTIDGAIMLRILERMLKANCPALAIHDSLVCRVADVEFARQTMEAVYRLWVRGFVPVINRVF